MFPSLSIRHYSSAGRPHTHDHMQWVAPYKGGMHIELGNRSSWLDQTKWVMIASEQDHVILEANKAECLVLDVPKTVFSKTAWDAFAKTPFQDRQIELRHLIGFTAARVGHGELTRRELAHLTELLLSSIRRTVGLHTEIAELRYAIQSAPDLNWSIPVLQKFVGRSRTQIFEWFQMELGCTPMRFVMQARLEHAHSALLTTNESISQIAVASGFSDQSALTRSMRRIMGHTPGSIRRSKKLSVKN